MKIEVTGLSKFYGSQKAVDNISFTLGEGELLGFLGPNGAGKSTTMRILSCFLTPDEGDVKCDGESVFEFQKEYKKKIGYLPEHNPLYPDMFITDYLNYMASLQGVIKKKRLERVREMIAYCGLEKEIYKKIGELSKGYRQRVGLAQAMVHDPELLILDEPTSGLDPNQIVEIREYIKKIGKEKAILLSTHNLAEVEASCRRVLIINQGRIVADDSSGNLRGTSKETSVTVDIEASIPNEILKKQLLDIKSVRKVEHAPDKGFILISSDSKETIKEVNKLCRENDWILLEIHLQKESLEQIFRRITTGKMQQSKQ